MKLNMKLRYKHNMWMPASFVVFGIILLILGACGTATASNETVTVAILMGGQNRQALVDGVQAGLADLGHIENETITYQIYNANGDNKSLSHLAKEIVSAQPDLVIAAGGLEADAAHEATTETDIPVVFTGVSSSVGRGIVDSMRSSGNNVTGVDTGYTELSGKRLEIFHQMMPEVKNVAVIVVPEIAPSAQSLSIVQEVAPDIGINLVVFEAGPEQDFGALANDIVASDAEALFMIPASPLQQAMGEWIYPTLSQNDIPIFGVFSSDLKRGAFAFYGGDQLLMGRQSARLADAVLGGALPSDIPVEMPADLQLVINRSIVDTMGLDLLEKVWRQADSIVEIPIASR